MGGLLNEDIEPAAPAAPPRSPLQTTLRGKTGRPLLASLGGEPEPGLSPAALPPSTARLLDGRPGFRCWWALANSARRGRVYDQIHSFIQMANRPQVKAPPLELLLPGLPWETDRQLNPRGSGLGGGPGASYRLQGGQSSKRGNVPRAPIERRGAPAPPGMGGAFLENDNQTPAT